MPCPLLFSSTSLLLHTSQCSFSFSVLRSGNTLFWVNTYPFRQFGHLPVSIAGSNAGLVSSVVIRHANLQLLYEVSGVLCRCLCKLVELIVNKLVQNLFRIFVKEKNLNIMKKALPLLSVISLMFLASCSPKVVGTWQITGYENKTIGGEQINVSNIGTMTFKKGNHGLKEIKYSVLANQVSDTTSFKWKTDESTITIQSDGSDLNKTWIVMKNTGKVQVWKSTDGKNTVQTLELKKLKEKK